MQYPDIFKALSEVNVNDRLQKKQSGNKTFSYLPWADCEQYAYNTIDPDLIQVDQFETDDGLVVLQMPGDGFMVKCTVTIAGVARGDWYPVIDYDNRVIKNPNAFDINTALQRAKVKAFAQHGLGLYVFLGKDGPDEYNPNDGTNVPNTPPAKPASKPATTQAKPPTKPSAPTPKTPTKPATKPEQEADATASDATSGQDEAPWEGDETAGTVERDWAKPPFDEAYIVDFVAKLDAFKTTAQMMEWVQSVIAGFDGNTKTEYRTLVQPKVMARAKVLNATN